MNSTISWLIQQLIMRSNLGDGAGRIEKYELSDILVASVDLEDLKVDLGTTRNFMEELGDLKSLHSVNPERVKFNTAILQAIGYKQKKERDEVMLEMYRATYQMINTRLEKARNQKAAKTQRNKIELTVYVDQLKIMLQEGNYKAKNNLRFAKELEKLVGEITSEAKLQHKILNSYWREKYKKRFNEKEIAQQDQTSLF